MPLTEISSPMLFRVHYLLSLLLVALFAAASHAQPATPALVPRPREGVARPSFAAPRGLAVDAPAAVEDRDAAADLTDALRERGQLASSAGAVRVRLLRQNTPAGREVVRGTRLTFDAAMVDEGYVLVAQDGRIDVVGATAAGVFYGAQTVKQLVDGRGARTRVAGMHIRDWPAMRWRGVHDDISRGPVPTLAFMKRQVRTFAAYKMNVYSPYIEHVLEYESEPLFAPPGGALTRADVRELMAYARRHHVEVIPEQEAFGHLHHVLRWEKYSPLGETPHGSVLAAGDPGTMPLVKRLFAELDTIFPGRFLHIGADETFDLGRGRTGDRVRAEGYAKVYADFVTHVADTLRPLGRKMLFWGDIATDNPSLIPSLPKDLIAIPWYYDAPLASYDKLLQPFRQAGMETWVAPGFANWGKIYPDYDIALPNIRAFVREGQRAGATGMLNTSWDDLGETLFNQTWAAVLFGAAASWQPGDSDVDTFLAAYPRVFHGDTSGHVLAAERKLMEVQKLLRTAGLGGAVDRLFWIDPWSAEGQIVARRVLPIARDLRLASEEAIEHVIAARRNGATRERDALDAIELGARRLDMVGQKFQTSDEIARIYARVYRLNADTATARTLRWYDLADITGINGRLQDLRDLYTLGRELYEASWRSENRPYWLGNVLSRYDAATQLWLGRIDRLNDVRTAWARDRSMPTADALGIPAPIVADGRP